MTVLHLFHIICLSQFIQNAPINCVESKNMVLAIILNEKTKQVRNMLYLKNKMETNVKLHLQLRSPSLQAGQLHITQYSHNITKIMQPLS